MNAVAGTHATRRLGAGRLVAYALPSLPLAMVAFPSYAVLPGFYSRHTQIPLATIGVILMVARVFDAVVDPLIGYLSDATKHQVPRKVWLICGGLVMSVSVVNLYVPPTTAGAAYYLGWFLAFYLGYSLIEITHKAWGTDIARDYDGRSRIATMLAVAFAVGNLVFAVAPFLSRGGSLAFDAETLSLVAWGVATILPLSVLAAVWFAPSGQPTPVHRGGFNGMLFAVSANRPLRWFMSMFVLTGLGQGVFYGLVFLYVGSVVQLADHFAWVLLADALVSLASVPLWYFIVRRIQKHRAWALGLAVSAFAILAMWMLPTGESALAPLMLLIGVRAFGASVVYVAPNALLGDVVDYELLKRGVNRAANFHALVSLVTKITASVGGGAGLLLIGLAGYDARALNPPEAVAAFKWIALIASACILLAGAALALRFPLDRERHEVVRRRIEKRGSHGASA